MGHASGVIAMTTAAPTNQKRPQPVSAHCAAISSLGEGVAVGECMKSHLGKEKARERLCGLEQSAGALDGRAGGIREGGAEPPGPAKQVDGAAVCLMRVRQSMRTYG